MLTFKNTSIFDPLEQFELIKLGNTKILQVSLVFLFIYIYILIVNSGKFDFYGLKHKKFLVKCTLNFILNITKNSLRIKRQNMFIIIFLIFIYILICNCTALIPYTFTTTSSLVVTLYLARMLFSIKCICTIVQIYSYHEPQKGDTF
jgi:F0F1-type ATP synthase membrane subunit a